MANGNIFADRFANLVMGGLGSQHNLTPTGTAIKLYSIDAYNSDQNNTLAAWLTGKYNMNGDYITSIDVIIEADPDTITRKGFLLIGTYIGTPSPIVPTYDTVYVTQPGVRCVDPKQENAGQEFFVAFMENVEDGRFSSSSSTTDASFATQLFLYATSDYPSTSVKVFSSANMGT
jgi:hypothetical protein